MKNPNRRDVMAATALGALAWMTAGGGRAASLPRYVDYKAFVALDAKFHSRLARLSGNDRLQGSIERLHAHLHTYRLWAQRAATPIHAVEEHRAIAKAVCDHDEAAAAAAMRRHLQGARQRLLDALDADSGIR